jgi:hypothetical protein
VKCAEFRDCKANHRPHVSLVGDICADESCNAIQSTDLLDRAAPGCFFNICDDNARAARRE